MDEKKVEKGGRISGTVTQVNKSDILLFYENRAKKFKEENPYAVTMLQDQNPQLVRDRNKRETEKLLPLLLLDSDSKILDVACGIGRWYDAIDTEIKEYCGVDFCRELIQIAKTKHQDCRQADFLTGSAMELESVLAGNGKGTYNRVLMIGILLCFNDEDVRTVLEQVSRVSEQDAILCIREPIGINDRLTLKDFYSEELEDHYNAIYRTRDELMDMFEDTLLSAGFQLEKEGWMFGDELNNRKETAQYYFVFRRKS